VIRTILSIITISLFFIFVAINFNTVKYQNPLEDFDESIFKILLLEDLGLFAQNPMASTFVFHYDGLRSYLITNEHVCGVSTGAPILIQNTEESYNVGGAFATIVTADDSKDLCILSVEEKLSPLKIPEKSNIFLGEKLYIIGAPEGSFPHISEVIVTKVNFNKDLLADIFSEISFSYDPYLVSGDVFYGQSGSPVINKKGEVQGIIFAKSGAGSGLIIKNEEIHEYITSSDPF